MWKQEKRNAEARKEKCGSIKQEMWKQEMKKCRRQVNLIGRAKFENNIKQKSTTGGVHRLFAKRQHDG